MKIRLYQLDKNKMEFLIESPYSTQIGYYTTLDFFRGESPAQPAVTFRNKPARMYKYLVKAIEGMIVIADKAAYTKLPCMVTFTI